MIFEFPITRDDEHLPHDNDRGTKPQKEIERSNQ